MAMENTGHSLLLVIAEKLNSWAIAKSFTPIQHSSPSGQRYCLTAITYKRALWDSIKKGEDLVIIICLPK